MDVKTAVREFIVSNFYLPDPANFADEASLLDSGLVDSTGVLEIISFLERTFDTAISDEELVPENLDSIARITAFVERKRQMSSAA
jgi:acyl carrier protein